MILSLLDAMGATTGYKRPIREGEEVLEGGFVVAIGCKDRNGDQIHIQALVLRTSGIASKHPALVEIWVDTKKPYGSRVTKENSPECGCPAGSSEKCKHIIAVMLYLARIEVSDLEDLTCTDIEQQWGALKKSKLSEYEAKELTELCHVKAKRSVYVSNLPEVTKEMQDNWRTKLNNCAVLSEYSLFTSCLRQGSGVCGPEDQASVQEEDKIILKTLLTFRTWSVLAAVRKLTSEKLLTLDPTLVQFYEDFVDVSLQESVSIAAFPQGSDEWKQCRRLRQTANKARAQYTYYVNANADWDKRYQELFHSNFQGNEYTADGLKGEIVARELYESKYNCKVFESGLLVRPELPWLGASLDGTVIDEHGNFIKNLEVKTFKEGKRLTAQELVEFNCVSTVDKNGNVKKANNHYAQMQIGMLLSGIDTCDYVLYSELHSGNIFEVPVSFDGKHVYELCTRLVNVYFEKFLPCMMQDHSSSN